MKTYHVATVLGSPAPASQTIQAAPAPVTKARPLASLFAPPLFSSPASAQVYKNERGSSTTVANVVIPYVGSKLFMPATIRASWPPASKKVTFKLSVPGLDRFGKQPCIDSTDTKESENLKLWRNYIVDAAKTWMKERATAAKAAGEEIAPIVSANDVTAEDPAEYGFSVE